MPLALTRIAAAALPLALIALVVSLAILPAGPISAEEPQSQQATIAVDPFLWQIDEDYPGANPNDAALPITRMLVKTHDATQWMSTYDDNPLAVSGPAALKKLVDLYSAQNIETVAWFVPKGTDIETQLTMAKQVIDTPGVKGLYADVEPFAGFCYPNCAMLAEQFWKRLRQERPDAHLGVIYDPREWWLEEEAAAAWLKHADVAAPMCYWESFVGQGAWNDPAGCIIQGYYTLRSIVGHDILYEPAFQGDATPARFTQALDAALDLGSERVTVWRRGTVSQATWDAIASYAGVIDRPCWLEMPDGCLLREIGKNEVYVIHGGARFHVPSPQALKDLGYTFADVDPAPSGFMETVPNVPRDDTLIQEYAGPDIHIVYGGARFRIADSNIASPSLLTFNLELTRVLPPGGLDQVPTVPADYTRFREDSVQEQYLVVSGGRVHISQDQLNALNAAGYAKRLYLLPDGALDGIPITDIQHGDVSCDGSVAATDALMMLQSIAGVPNPGVCSTRDFDCDGAPGAVDALKLLRSLAGLDVDLGEACLEAGSLPLGSPAS